ncbi:Superoxide dismutase [Fe] [Babesia microti strain RI]|uniref:Superoxide dismutase n=1 Tax=Babesia microti (strain RI) TaxID=1133968 RepID=A0A1N6LYB7_BABMR|nr:Superoxide dismutase [Fe] [Babesia microti strain RI]SIO73876.1 Superoxide dismutase [Fe] [Babesia microti strain RI]|eukprot:XP_021337928.1 Superoxide dismutase [Fe] [Babesia microti strain RI]
MMIFSSLFYCLLIFAGLIQLVSPFRQLRNDTLVHKLHSLPINQSNSIGGRFELIELPYNIESLTPFMSKDAIEMHYLRHHAKYVNTLNQLVSSTNSTFSTLKDIVSAAEDIKIYNNAAQAYNHNLFWYSMTPQSNSPTGCLLRAINASFGSIDKLLNEIILKGIAHFGSGWVFLTRLPDGSLTLCEGHDAECPIRYDRGIPLLALDVWEHAYYVDYRYDRERYIRGWVDHINWVTAEQLYSDASNFRNCYSGVHML